MTTQVAHNTARLTQAGFYYHHFGPDGQPVWVHGNGWRFSHHNIAYTAALDTMLSNMARPRETKFQQLRGWLIAMALIICIFILGILVLILYALKVQYPEQRFWVVIPIAIVNAISVFFLFTQTIKTN